MNIRINNESYFTITKSLDEIAERLLKDFILQINESYYRIIDLEFYYYAEGIFEDIYVHKHEAQLLSGKWYFHGSGIDITFGDGKNHGGILIRAIGQVSSKAGKERKFLKKEIHGPINVKTEICSNLYGAFAQESNVFRLNDISQDRMGALMIEPKHIIKTKRIGLNPNKVSSNIFHSAKLRYIAFPSLKHKNKGQIALDMKEQLPNLSIKEINQELGSTFLQ